MWSNTPTGNRSVSLYELSGPQTKRRALFKYFLLTPLAFFAKGMGSAFGATPVPVPTEEELKPFREIAARKGAKFVLGPASRAASANGEPPKMHLDMDMVRASIDNAIARTRKQGLEAIAARLERLRDKGTAAQQVDFVLGSGQKYFFPEDVEKWAEQAEKDKFHSFGVVCNTVCYTICKCSCWFKDCTQECTERCREIFC
jgi:hypothetical protein